ncbi:MAG: hypothetical protein SFY67_11725 [Candidatus Melainabacteria bacterium]|nr:hypothetical protein [Candidatus Melainabacteria bacterium]
MKNHLRTVSLLSVATMLSLISPASADEIADENPAKLKDPITAPEIKKRPDAAEDTKDLPPVKSLHSDVKLPVRVASFTTGFILGTPVSIVRAFGRQTKAGSKDLIGESKNPVLLATTYLFSVPFAFAGAPFEGVGMSAINSWNGSGDEPFGKESFSLQPSEE